MSSLNFTSPDLSLVDPEETSYGYIPDRTVCYLFLVLFSVSTLMHICQGLWFRMWWTLPTIILGGCLEVLGWSGRLWSSFNPMADSPFMIQIVCTIIGPTPLLAANFIILGALIRTMGPMYSRLSPRTYSLFFVSCDILSLVIQGSGGGIASAADDHDGADMGGKIMLGGIIFQLVLITVYSLLASEFLWRYLRDAPVPSKARRDQSQATLGEQRGGLTTKTTIMLFALGFNLLVIFIRAIYRTIELADGWDGRIITTEIYFNVLDGAMIVLAIYTLNISHPGLMLGRTMGKEFMEKDSSSVQLAPMQTGV